MDPDPALGLRTSPDMAQHAGLLIQGVAFAIEDNFSRAEQMRHGGAKVPCLQIVG